MTKNPALDERLINFIVGKLDRYINRKREKERELEEKIWLKKFGTADFILHQVDEATKIKLYKDSVLSKYIYEGFEKAEIDFLKHLLSKGDYFIDIGANIGLFSLVASPMVGDHGCIISFEPASSTFRRLLENCELNGIHNVSAFQFGLSDQKQELLLNLSSSGHEAWNTFVPTGSDKFSSKESVWVQRLDDFILEQGIVEDRIALIKLDVEGFELNVLKGADHLLSRENAPVWMIEFTEENALAAGNCCHEIYKIMVSYGYDWYSYDPSGMKLIAEPLRLNYPYNNLIAIKNPNEKLKRILRGTEKT